MYKWKIKQDKLTVARGQAKDKASLISQVQIYVMQYLTEDFSKMQIVIERKTDE